MYLFLNIAVDSYSRLDFKSFDSKIAFNKLNFNNLKCYYDFLVGTNEYSNIINY